MKTKQLLAFTGLIVLGMSNAGNAFPKFRSPIKRTQISSASNFSNRRFFRSNFRAPNSSRLRFTIGGAVRSNDLCAIDSVDSAEIKALVSAKDMALTSQSHPELFVSFPTLSGDKTADLIVKNESESYYQETSVTIPAAGGNLGLKVPESFPPLEVGEEYSWFLKVQCGEVAQVEDPLVSGSIGRIALNLPQFDSLEDRVEFFNDSGVWYDTLASANELSQGGDSRYWDVLTEEFVK